MSYYIRKLDEIADELERRDSTGEHADLVEEIRSITLNMDTEAINASFHSD